MLKCYFTEYALYAYLRDILNQCMIAWGYYLFKICMFWLYTVILA